jgi:hypothetical protein
VGEGNAHQRVEDHEDNVRGHLEKELDARHRQEPAQMHPPHNRAAAAVLLAPQASRARQAGAALEAAIETATQAP